MTSRFQSTHPARGATPYWCVLARPAFHFNPRTPRGVRHLLAEGQSAILEFQSTHPARGATQTGGVDYICQIISIHAPREGCDAAAAATSTTERFISIHAPREGCDSLPGVTVSFVVPISIHAPREGCDIWLVHSLAISTISIHAPREGCDLDLAIQAAQAI